MPFLVGPRAPPPLLFPAAASLLRFPVASRGDIKSAASGGRAITEAFDAVGKTFRSIGSCRRRGGSFSGKKIDHRLNTICTSPILDFTN
jgi:hypothetical protein